MPPLLRLLFVSCVCVTAAAAERDYELDYHARFVPDEDHVEARLVVSQSRSRLVTLDFNAPRPRYHDFTGDGDVERDGDRLVWEVPASGGELCYRVLVDHRRDGAYDARLTPDWVVVRLDDLFPPVAARSKVSARAVTRLYLSGPSGWSFETPYGPVEADGVSVDTEGRRFDRPLGWMTAGDLGIRRTMVAGRRIAVAGPRNQSFRRMDVLTFLSWTLPELVRIAPSLPHRVLVVGGSQDMWRGGLSGPGSLYLHPDRPLVSGNSTSTLLHELVHIATDEPPEPGADWIVEGLAEYYSLVILLRTGGISGRRFQRALEDLERWSREEDGRLDDPSTGADTARAVLLFRDLDLELREAGASLDRVSAELLEGRVSLKRLVGLAEAQLGGSSEVLAPVLEVPARNGEGYTGP